MGSPYTQITEHTVTLGSHEMFYLAAGPEDGPLVIFAHGWPELGYSWRHQLPVLGGLGFRAIAPDLRGHGRSSLYPRHDDYTMEKHVADLIGLLDAQGREKAVWVGHDWGSPVVWSLVSHHPERTHAVASLCVPYAAMEDGLERLVELVDRTVYPEDEYPAGQWDYQYYYEENLNAQRPCSKLILKHSSRQCSAMHLDQTGVACLPSPQRLGAMAAGLMALMRLPTCPVTMKSFQKRTSKSMSAP